jgi:hypothetical protein
MKQIVLTGQTIVASMSAAVGFYSEVIPLNGMDRVVSQLVVNYIWGPAGNTPKLSVTVLASDDGAHFTPVDTAIEKTATGASVDSRTVTGAYLRFLFGFDPGQPGTGVGAVCFDLNVLIDHA